MSQVTNPEIIEELQSLCEKGGGVLHPKAVIEAARPESSPLHTHFEWDDDKAAEDYRLWQARALISQVRVHLVTPSGKKVASQVFVSLKSDRDKGGYRTMVDVLSHKDMRNELVRDALTDMQNFTQRYNTLRELATVRHEMGKASKKLAQKVK